MLALIGGRAQLAGLRVAAHMDRLTDHLLRTELWMTDRLGDPKMLDLRVGKGLVDRIDRPARDARLVETLDPVSVRVLPNDLGEVRVERRPVSRARDNSREIRAVGQVL